MDYNNWVLASRVATIVGGVCTLLGLIGLLFFTGKVKAKDNEKISDLEDNLKARTTELQKLTKYEEKRQRDIREFEKLKKTPPEITINNLFIENDVIILKIDLKNKVPFKFDFRIFSKTGEISNTISLGKIEIKPKPDEDYIYAKYGELDKVIKAKKVASKGKSIIKVILNYESSYFIDSRNENLRGKIEKEFLIDIVNRKIENKAE